MGEVAPDLDIVAVDGPNDLPSIGRHAARITFPTNLGWSAVSLPLALRRRRFDVFHAPAYTAPLWNARPLVLTVHDITYETHPEWYPYRIDPIRRWFYRKSASSADRLITDSSFSRSEIIRSYGIPSERIDVIPLGVETLFRTNESVTRERYMLHVGDLHARRNLPFLIDVLEELRKKEGRLAPRLVFVGKDRGEWELLRRRVAERSLSSHVEYLGEVDDATLVGLYQRAAALTYPSRYEGFGLPVIEAMACGTPVVAARAAALPEVCGDAAITLEPDDTRGWIAAVQAILDQPEVARDLSQRGQRHSASFTWRSCALRTLETYRTVASPRR